MRILFASASSGSLGGGEKYLLILGDALKQQGHEIALWCSSHPRMDGICNAFSHLGTVLRSEYSNTYDFWHRGLLSPTLPPRIAKRLRADWLAWKPDLIHLNKQCLEDGLDLLSFARALPLPLVTTIHITQTCEEMGSILGGLRDWNARRILQQSPGVFIAVSKERAEALQRFVGDDHRVVALENGIPAVQVMSRDEARRSEAIPDNCVAVAAVGRLDKQKRPLLFLREIARMREAGIPVHARWLGASCEDPEWSAAIRGAGLGTTVRTVLWRENIASILPAYDLLLHTAAYEGLPFALLEALQAGLPCVVSEEVHSQLPPALRECMLPLGASLDWKMLFSQPDLLQTLATKGRQVVAEHYTSEAMARRHLNLYSTLSRENR